MKTLALAGVLVAGLIGAADAAAPNWRSTVELFTISTQSDNSGGVPIPEVRHR